LKWLFVFKVFLLDLIFDCLSEESISINWSFSLGTWVLLLIICQFISIIIFNSAVLNEILSFFEQLLVFSLEHFQFLQGIISNFLELPLILSVNLSLDVAPVVMRVILLYIILDRLPLLNSLCWHGRNSRTNILLLLLLKA
jgi:hypothetical protein